LKVSQFPSPFPQPAKHLAERYEVDAADLHRLLQQIQNPNLHDLDDKLRFRVVELGPGYNGDTLRTVLGYAWKMDKDGETVGIEDPKCPNHLMSAARYRLTMLAGEGAIYDPQKKEREHVQVSITRRKLTKNNTR
jgi:hypothetical protein